MDEYVEKINFINSDTSQKDIVTYHVKLFENAENIHINRNYLNSSIEGIDEIELTACLFELRNVVNNEQEFNSLFESHNELKDRIYMFISDFIHECDLIIAHNEVSDIAYEDKIKEYTENLSKDVNSKINVLTDLLEETEEKSSKAQEKIDKLESGLLTQMVAIISIFVSIAFVMFGGMTLMNNLFDFSDMTSVPVIEIVCLGSLLGVVMIGVISVFIFLIENIINRTTRNPINVVNISFVSRLIMVLFIIFIMMFCLWGCIQLDRKSNLELSFIKEYYQ